MEEVKDALCLGISVVTGPMIRETVEVAKAIKKWDPDFPVILGGWHPSLLPTQTLEAPYVDIVVRAQGEESMLAVAEGYPTARSAYRLARRHGVVTPVIDEVYAMFYEGKNVAEAVRDLMSRDLKPE